MRKIGFPPKEEQNVKYQVLKTMKTLLNKHKNLIQCKQKKLYNVMFANSTLIHICNYKQQIYTKCISDKSTA